MVRTWVVQRFQVQIDDTQVFPQAHGRDIFDDWP